MGDGNDEVSDDEDEDEEDQGLGHPKEAEQKQPDFIVNMYNALRESECEWQQREDQTGRGSAPRLGSSVSSPSWTFGFFLDLHSLCFPRIDARLASPHSVNKYSLLCLFHR